MRWQRGYESSDVEDRRGQRAPMRLGGVPALSGGGLVAVLVIYLIARALGVTGGGGGGDTTQPAMTSADERELYQFVSFVFDDVQKSWEDQFRRLGKPYRHAKLVVFTDAVDSACGITGSEVGPFYCPRDQKAYIDLSFYSLLRDKLGAGGDFAQAYVLAHEMGHHVQNLLGENERNGSRDNETSVRMELQADCLAGVWAHSTDQRKLLEAGDIEESMNAAEQIGDDRLQRRGGGRVNPETFTHGTSEQRQRWFKRGLNEGDPRACDTFRGDI
ncbi:MAG TPA: neutral zinc metallopeptidase [Kofleriaceae bacterium]|nr:neutral zinc metallopeptidase [Kofleriaceae bacterium]